MATKRRKTTFYPPTKLRRGMKVTADGRDWYVAGYPEVTRVKATPFSKPVSVNMIRLRRRYPKGQSGIVYFQYLGLRMVRRSR